MSSKLEPHTDLILQMLLAGETYRKIVDALSVRDCTTSLTNLNDWVKRRSKRIVRRANLVNPPIDPIRPIPAESAPAILPPATLQPVISEIVGIKTTPIEKKSNNNSSPVQPAPGISSDKKFVLPPAENHRTLHVKGPVISAREKSLDEFLAAEELANPTNKGLVYTKEMADMSKRSSGENIK